MAQRKNKPAQESPYEPVVDKQEQGADEDQGLSDIELESAITIKQIPVIEEQLEILHTQIVEKAELLMAMEASEETLKEIKKSRAWNNKLQIQLKDRINEIIAELAAPVTALKQKFNEMIILPLNQAEADAKKKVDSVEDGIKEAMRIELEEYFKEYASSQNLTGVKLESANIGVIRSISMTNLKKQAKTWIDRVSGEMVAINTMPHADEIYAEYEKDYNLGKAAKTVSDRYAAIEKAKKEREAREEAEKQRQAAAAQAQAAAEAYQKAEQAERIGGDVLTVPSSDFGLVPSSPDSLDYYGTSGHKEQQLSPIPLVVTSETYEAVFAVLGTIEEIAAVKQFMNERGIRYESR